MLLHYDLEQNVLVPYLFSYTYITKVIHDSSLCKDAKIVMNSVLYFINFHRCLYGTVASLSWRLKNALSVFAFAWRFVKSHSCCYYIMMSGKLL